MASVIKQRHVCSFGQLTAGGARLSQAATSDRAKYLEFLRRLEDLLKVEAKPIEARKKSRE